jgi:hypothetical protein
MKTFRLPIPALIALVVTLAFASLAQAQATRTWVSGVGDDANPCSRTAPCKTFAGAISKTAAGGEINALDDGGFGSVTITKAITIDGGGHIAGVLAPGTNGIVVNAATGDTVTLRNLDINGAGTGLVGIRILGAKAVHIERCQIYGFRNATSGRAISDLRTATQTPRPALFVNDSFIRDNLTGIGITGTSPSVIRAMIRNTHLYNNNGFAVLGSNSANVTLEDSNILDNNGDGFRVDTSAQGALIRCLIVRNNGTAILSSAGSTVFLSGNSVFNNTTGVSGLVVTFGDNNVTNNIGGNTLPVSVGQQ